jgi:hypothetical protein
MEGKIKSQLKLLRRYKKPEDAISTLLANTDLTFEEKIYIAFEYGKYIGVRDGVNIVFKALKQAVKEITEEM